MHTEMYGEPKESGIMIRVGKRWSFDHFCSPYMDGRMRIVMVEDNALLEEVSVVGYDFSW